MANFHTNFAFIYFLHFDFRIQIIFLFLYALLSLQDIQIAVFLKYFFFYFKESWSCSTLTSLFEADPHIHSSDGYCHYSQWHHLNQSCTWSASAYMLSLHIVLLIGQILPSLLTYLSIVNYKILLWHII